MHLCNMQSNENLLILSAYCAREDTRLNSAHCFAGRFRQGRVAMRRVVGNRGGTCAALAGRSRATARSSAPPTMVACAWAAPAGAAASTTFVRLGTMLCARGARFEHAQGLAR